jgi:hypothetical protein
VPFVECEGAGDRFRACRTLGEIDERGLVGVFRQCRTRLRQALLDSPEERDRRRPRSAVPGLPFRTEVRAEREQLRQVGHDADVALRGYAHEAVGVEVIPEQDARVPVGRREEPRRAVVQQVALVDRLDPERKALLSKRREDRELFPFALRLERGLPKRALTRRLGGDRRPDGRRA